SRARGAGLGVIRGRSSTGRGSMVPLAGDPLLVDPRAGPRAGVPLPAEDSPAVACQDPLRVEFPPPLTATSDKRQRPFARFGRGEPQPVGLPREPERENALATELPRKPERKTVCW